MPQTAIQRMQESNEHGQTDSDKEKLVYRTRASQSWVSHYVRVSELKEAWVKENPEGVFTAAIAEQLLIDSWETKEEVKATEGI